MRFLDRYLRQHKWWRKWRGLPEPLSPAMVEITREALRILASKAELFADAQKDYPQSWDK